MEAQLRQASAREQEELAMRLAGEAAFVRDMRMRQQQSWARPSASPPDPSRPGEPPTSLIGQTASPATSPSSASIGPVFPKPSRPVDPYRLPTPPIGASGRALHTAPILRLLAVCIGIALLILTPIWLHDRSVARQYAQAEHSCGPLFSTADSLAIFGSAPSGGKLALNGDFGNRMDMCEFTIPYSGQTVTLAVGYTCGAGAVNAAWNSNEEWGNDPRLKGFKHAVYDNSNTETPTQAVAAKFRSYGVPRMAWLEYFDSAWVPAEGTTVALLKRVISHGSSLQSC